MVNIESLIKTIKNSFKGSDYVYTAGSCYKFYEVLKEVFPEAKPLINQEGQHIVSLIDGKCYDINGLVKNPDDFGEMTKEQIEYFTDRIFNIADPHFFVPDWVVDSCIPFMQTAQFAFNLDTTRYGYKIVPIESEEEYEQIEKSLYSMDFGAYPEYQLELEKEQDVMRSKL